MTPADIVNVVKDSGLRGRGGAGFPTGVKWSFMKPGDGKPHYLCCNADESEPGTFKDREIMRWTPHALVEGCAIGAYAIGAETCYIYIRGEFTEPIARVESGAQGSYAAGILGKNAMGTGKTVNVWVHRGAGAYICGEETALMNSLEGKRGNPRIKPPFPAVSGVFAQPTTINNVETLAAVPHILNNGAAWYKQWMRAGQPEEHGHQALFGVRQHRSKPGQLRSADGLSVQGIPVRSLRRPAAGPEVQGDHPRRHLGADPDASTKPKRASWTTRASSRKGTMLGSGGVIVIDDAQNLVKQIARAARFFAHESCAQCTQCREGTAWTTKILERIVAGDGTTEDLDTLLGDRREHDGQDDLRAERFVRDAGRVAASRNSAPISRR